MASSDILQEVEAFVFDVFGTTVDWHTTVSRQIQQRSHGLISDSGDAAAFAEEWRDGYKTNVRRIAEGGEGSLNIDVVHRQILDTMLESPRWTHLSSVWSEEERQDLSQIWHRLDGYSDTSKGLEALKKNKIIATLSNGNTRLLIDMAKHANLPWDAIFSAEMFSSYKPNPKVYLGAAYHLSLPPHKIALVAAHIYDLRGAASAGFKTVYVPRPSEDSPTVRAEVRMKKDGGEVDLIVESFLELAQLVSAKE
ncbi:hypothetical protein SERLA73DRAFT_125803 [Serpula lacrymans var. lacrymans S7.3]|uniref:Haloacid dehalogenase n=2 Tax=Serpula lacrymans var. lacrymans TaxID=341189 RepID=F8QBR7_SERL3|nr:uncharacterized protein SERLADRAFT_400854 [Serpula lacrymans var. lacrymans S7.9]EGN94278.1 hypothetical protein SERLA73DRAFT_125803 [Serpula lacrymans var. lacrymans S7.3]EGO19769.1 hypothetical protein SERLADRAFT_400854 [Serpula lacrymans var. lacrymans S7.9]